MPETPNAIGYRLLPRTAPDTEQQQVLKRIFDPLAGHSTTVRTNRDECKPEVDYFSITRDVSG